MADHVDPNWYLKSYPDVAAAGVDARQHYVRFGRFENRYPCELQAVVLENELWSGDHQIALSALRHLLSVAGQNPIESSFSSWLLARWHGSNGEWHEALEALRAFSATGLGSALVAHSGPVLLACMALRESGAGSEAQALLARAMDTRGRLPDFLLEGASQAEDKDALNCLNELFQGADLLPVVNSKEGEGISLDTLGASPRRFAWRAFLCRLRSMRQPLVSVILPTYNAQHTIATALNCLRRQTWRSLEILVVDDASTDETVACIESVAAQDKRIVLIRHQQNQGAYAARNTGLAAATGEFITVHDSDDWSHPEKIERQVRALLANPKLQATISSWARCTTDLRFFRERMEEGYIHPNMSSLMFRRQVFTTLGYWDRVRAGADSEYYHRIGRAFGEASIGKVMPGIPLTFGRHLPESLTQVSVTHWRTFYKGVRRDYFDAARKWHDETAAVADLYLDASPCRRPFPAPAALCR